MNEKTKKALAEALMPIPKEIPYVNSGGCGVFDRDIYCERLAELIEEAVEKIVGPANTHARDLI